MSGGPKSGVSSSKRASPHAKFGVCLAAAFVMLCVSATTFAGNVTYQYDSLGRLKSATYADGTTITYTLDPTGNRQTVASGTTAGILQLTAATASVAENGASIVLNVSRTGGSTGAVAVSYATSNGTAMVGSDFTTTTGTLNWANGNSANKTITVPILDDSTYEGNEVFAVTLSGATGSAVLGAVPAAAVTITENDVVANGVLSFSTPAYSGLENAGTVTITVQRTGGSTGAVSVQYATSDGSANVGTDYTSASGTLNWANGNAANKTFTVPVTNDTAGEPNETVNLTLSGATGGAVIGSGAATLTINDNETGQLQFTMALQSVGEAGASVSVDVNRVNGSYTAASVNYATANGSAVAGSDFTTASGTLNWATGVGGVKSFTVSITDDSALEATETFLINLSGVTGATLGSPSSQKISIADNETGQPGTLSLSPANPSALEGAGPATITVTRSGGSDGAVSVQYNATDGTAVAGSDYTATLGSLNWNNGDTASKSFSIPIVNDSIGEAAETISLTLSNPTGGAVIGTGSGTHTILDDEPGVLQFSATSFSGSEATSPMPITVQRVNGSYGAVGVSYATAGGTAISGTDFTATSGTLSWINGDGATKQISVPITNDAPYEGDETFTVSLSSATGGATIGGTNPVTATILDDDGPGVPTNLHTAPVGISYGGGFTVSWNTATGMINHYTLNEEIVDGPGTGTVNTYTIVAPATSKAFAKGTAARTWEYKVRACQTSNETICSAWTATVDIDVCPAGGCP